MKKICLFIFIIAILSSCAEQSPKATVVAERARQIKTVYVWDADGHSNLSLLKGLKAEAKKQLKEKGLIVVDDPSSTESYAKVTVLSAYNDPDKGKAYISARMYLIDASDNSIFYDKTAEAKASGGGENGPGYPIEKIIRELLLDYPAVKAK